MGRNGLKSWNNWHRTMSRVESHDAIMRRVAGREPLSKKKRVICTCDTSALAKNFCMTRCLSSCSFAESSLEEVAVGGTTTAAWRYTGLGDGVVVDDDGVAMD